MKSAEDKTNKKFCFEVATPLVSAPSVQSFIAAVLMLTQETYFMYADSEKEKDEWIGHIGRAIVRSSSGKEGYL